MLTKEEMQTATSDEAFTTFGDSLAVVVPELFMPVRSVPIRASARKRELFVVCEERRNYIRPVSARRASPSKMRKYEVEPDVQ